MKQLMFMIEKEWIESLRTHKVIPFIIIILILGIISPFTALIMPDVLKSALPDSMKSINIPKATYIDAYTQFFKNINQIGMIVLVITFSGTLTNEFYKGTLINLITKGLSRKYIILSKWMMSIFIWSIAYLFGAVAQYFYTIYYFNNDGNNKFYAYFISWLFGLMLLSLIMLISTILKTNIAVMLGILLFIISMFALSLFQDIKDKLPLQLIQNNTNLLLNKVNLSDLSNSIIVTILFIFISVILSIYQFNKVKL